MNGAWLLGMALIAIMNIRWRIRVAAWILLTLICIGWQRS